MSDIDEQQLFEDLTMVLISLSEIYDTLTEGDRHGVAHLISNDGKIATTMHVSGDSLALSFTEGGMTTIITSTTYCNGDHG